MEESSMRKKNYVLRISETNYEVLKQLSGKSMKSINQYLNSVLENHIKDTEEVISSGKLTCRAVLNK